MTLSKVWLVVHYDWEDSDVVCICTSRDRAYEKRKEYLKNNRGEAKNISVVKYELDKIGSIFE